METLIRTHRQLFIQNLFPKLVPFRYAFLKFFVDSLEDISPHSDIDLLVDKTEIPKWKDLLGEQSHIRKVIYREKNFGVFVEIYFEDRTYLELDLIHTLKWKHVEFMSVEEVLRNVKPNAARVKVPPIEVSFEYIFLFFGLNNSPVPEKYVAYFQTLDRKVMYGINDYFLNKYELGGGQIPDFFDMRSNQKYLLNYLKKIHENKGLSGLKNRVHYLRDFFEKPRPLITFSGVDGAGKTTVLTEIQNLLSKKYRRDIVLLRQRPGMLPILSALKYGKEEANRRTREQLPRTGKNKSRISSLIRFAWYLMDILLGQWIVRFKYSKRGKVVLYDRYFFDFIADSRRNNIVLPSGFIKWFYNLIFSPELNTLLYADPDVILERKQELSKKDIVCLTCNYRALFDELATKNPDSQYLQINNTELSETLAKIEKAFLQSIFSRN